MKRLLLIFILDSCYLLGAASSSSDNLFSAINKHDVKRVSTQIARGANPNIINSNNPKFSHSGGNTPLHVALERYRNNLRNNKPAAPDYFEIAKILIPKTNVFILNEAQATPLHMIAGFSYEIDPAWLAENPDKKRQMDEKKGVLFHSTQEIEGETLANLAQRIVNRASEIARYDNNAIKQFINAQDEFGRTALHWAAIHGYKALAKYLINAGTNVNAQAHDVSLDGRTRYPNRGATPLMNAAKKGNLDIMRELINAGANVNARDTTKGRTALQWVLRMREGAHLKHGNQMSKEIALQAIDMLLKAGANPDIKDQPWIDNERRLIPGRSAVEWSMHTSPWPAYDNRELNLLRYYSKEARVATPRITTPPTVDRSKKPTVDCSQEPASAYASTSARSSQPPRINRTTKPKLTEALWWQHLTPLEKASLVYHAEHISSNESSQNIVDTIMTKHDSDAGIQSLDNAILSSDSLAIRFRTATGM
jgi:ankyrin repeat protein